MKGRRNPVARALPKFKTRIVKLKTRYSRRPRSARRNAA